MSLPIELNSHEEKKKTRVLTCTCVIVFEKKKILEKINPNNFLLESINFYEKIF